MWYHDSAQICVRTDLQVTIWQFSAITSMIKFYALICSLVGMCKHDVDILIRLLLLREYKFPAVHHFTIAVYARVLNSHFIDDSDLSVIVVLTYCPTFQISPLIASLIAA